MNNKILLFLIFLILILPVFASSSEVYFKDWQNNYYQDNPISDDVLKRHFDNLTEDTLVFDDFLKLDNVYEDVYWDKNSTEIKDIMNQDFKNADLDNNGVLSFIEFKNGFKLIFSYYQDNPTDYKYFKETDSNDDGKISLEEFEEISYIFIEDSFWDGYSIEEICQSEFDNANHDDDYLNYTEFKSAV